MTLAVTVESPFSCPLWSVPTEGRRHASTNVILLPKGAHRVGTVGDGKAHGRCRKQGVRGDLGSDLLRNLGSFEEHDCLAFFGGISSYPYSGSNAHSGNDRFFCIKIGPRFSDKCHYS